VVEVAALDADRAALEHRRAAQVIDERGQGVETRAQAQFALDVAAQAEEDRGHGRLRSISTPTARAWALAPGLVTRRRSQGMPKRASRVSARRSAKVSTSSKRAAAAKACTCWFTAA